MLTAMCTSAVIPRYIITVLKCILKTKKLEYFCKNQSTPFITHILLYSSKVIPTAPQKLGL